MAIGSMLDAVLIFFGERYDQIMDGSLDTDLLMGSKARLLQTALKDFDREHAYRNKAVLALELHGYNVVSSLMDMLWEGITTRERFEDPASKRRTPFAEYAYHRISENYRRIFEGKSRSVQDFPIRYREAQLLTDMISGMTDSYAIDLCEELEGFRRGPTCG